MRDKLLILIPFFLAAIPFISNAQKSASAVMDVSVRVLKATNVTAASSNHLNIDSDSYVSGKLGSVSIMNSRESDLFVELQDELELTDEKGNLNTFPVEVLKSGTDENLNFEFRAEKVRINQANSTGTLSGTMTTTVEYL